MDTHLILQSCWVDFRVEVGPSFGFLGLGPTSLKVNDLYERR